MTPIPIQLSKLLLMNCWECSVMSGGSPNFFASVLGPFPFRPSPINPPKEEEMGWTHHRRHQRQGGSEWPAAGSNWLAQWLFRICWLLLHRLHTHRMVNGQAAMWGRQQCPVGMFADGSCFYTNVCFDPQERCMNGICCQAQTGVGGQCPYGMFQDGSCSFTGICFDPRERCFNGICCQQNGGIGGGTFPTYPQYPQYPQYPTNPGFPGGGFPNYGGGYPNYGGGGYNTYGGYNPYGGGQFGGGGYGYPPTTGYGGFGGGVGSYNPYGTGIGYGVGVGVGVGVGYGGGIGMGGCRDYYATCAAYASYCFFSSIAEACMGSCGLCGGIRPGGGLIG